jgi:hypothetical protein
MAGTITTVYPISANLDLENRFTYHAPIAGSDQPLRYEALRDKAKEFADMIARYTPPSREQSMALTHLEHAVMQANAAIARHEDAPVGGS